MSCVFDQIQVNLMILVILVMILVILVNDCRCRCHQKFLVVRVETLQHDATLECDSDPFENVFTSHEIARHK